MQKSQISSIKPFFVRVVYVFYILTFFLYSDIASANQGGVAVEFIKGKCGASDHGQKFCEFALPKNWNDDEKSYLNRVFEKYREQYAYFFEVVSYGGIIEVQRFTSSATETDSGWTVERTAGWVSKEDNGNFVVNLSDAFFEAGIDPVSKFSRMELGFIHELAHVFDLKLENISSNTEFLEKSGCKVVFNPPDGLNIHDEFSKLTGYASSGKLEKAVATNRKVGIKYGFPTLYSMTSPLECFAEVTSV